MTYLSTLCAIICMLFNLCFAHFIAFHNYSIPILYYLNVFILLTVVALVISMHTQ